MPECLFLTAIKLIALENLVADREAKISRLDLLLGREILNQSGNRCLVVQDLSDSLGSTIDRGLLTSIYKKD
jgi:hypothetical protein